MSYTEPCHTGELYHVFTKSIAGYRVFNNDKEFNRYLGLLKYYKHNDLEMSFSRFMEKSLVLKVGPQTMLETICETNTKMVDILGYCILSTHFHLILKQNQDQGIAQFMSNVLNGYTRYFNLRHKRKGPLWVGRFRRRHVDDENDFINLTKYIHLNPTTAYIVDRPEEWPYSSYCEYLQVVSREKKLCSFEEYVQMEPSDYKEFVEMNIHEQREYDYARKWERDQM